MVVIAQNPTAYGVANIGGKGVDHIAWYEERFARVRPKQHMDVVTDDGSIYRWTRFSDSEPWTYDYRVRPDGTHDTVARQLPGKIDTLVERSDEVLY